MRLLAALLLLLGLGAAAPPRLVSDVSHSRIDIEYSFAGAELLVFGAIQYPGGRTPEDPPSIAVVVRGPAEPITVRRKEKVAGIWINTDAVRFETAPAFYSIASSAPIESLVDERTAAIYELGLGNLQLSPASGDTPEEIRTFERGLIDLRRRSGLYVENDHGVEITENVLYQSRVAIPALVPVGRYMAEIYLIRDGEVIARSTRPIEIDKSGLERAVYVAAQEHSLAYGTFAVSVALLAGWLAGAVVRR